MENINLDLDIHYENDEEYQHCLKKVYNIDDIDMNSEKMFEIMTERIVLLKEKLGKIEEISNLCNHSAKVMLTEEQEIGFLLLHSYHSFELFYKLYCHYFSKNEIDKDIYEKLLEKLK